MTGTWLHTVLVLHAGHFEYRHIMTDHLVLYIIAAALLVALAAILLIRFRAGKRLARTRYSTPLPTWGGHYRDALARRATKPSRIRTRRGGDDRFP